MPEPPGYLNKFQFIKWYVFSNCEAPWTLYVESVFPPTVHASQSLLMFDVGDAVRSAFRPKGDRRARHGRKTGKKRGKRGGGIPEPSDMLLNWVKETEEAKGRKISQGVKTLWEIDSVGQKWLGRLFIVGLIEDWLYEFCQLLALNTDMDCSIGRIRAKQDGIIMAEGFGFPNVSQVVNVSGQATYNHGAGVFGGTPYFVSFGATAKNTGRDGSQPWPCRVRLGLRWPAPGGGWNYEWGSWEELNVGDEKDVIVSRHVGHGEPTAWEIVAVSEGNWYELHGCIVFAVITGNPA